MTENKKVAMEYKMNFIPQGSFIVLESPEPAEYDETGAKKDRQTLKQERDELDNKPMIVLRMCISEEALENMKKRGFTYKVGDAVFLAPWALHNTVGINLDKTHNIMIASYDAVAGIMPFYEHEVQGFQLTPVEEQNSASEQ